MGYLLNGVWQDGWYDSEKTGGEFIRPEAAFRDRIVGNRSNVFAAEHRRYHLYVSLACPWAHRTLVFRKLKQLEDAISVSVVEPVMSEQGGRLATHCPITSMAFRTCIRFTRKRSLDTRDADCAGAMG